MDRNELIGKLNEYKHRVEQLGRYMNATKPSSLYINENSPYQQRRESFDSEIIRTEQDDYNDKAKFSFDQGELNEYKGNMEHALEYYSDAAELYLKAFKGYENDSADKLEARDNFTRALDKAESLKKPSLLLPPSPRTRSSSNASDHHRPSLSSLHNRSSSISSVSHCPTDDILTQKLSASEIEVLKHTSNVNDKTFLPWIDETDLKEQFSYPTSKYLDPEGSLRLSDKQLEKFGGWKRPADIMQHPQLICLISSTSIIQDIVTDCSFVASLCVAAAYERKFKKQLITSCIYPQNKHGQPCYNPNGKYVIKLVYNGIARKVVVDDLLPVSREGTLMCTFSTNKGELWASIIEKAYMKLMGGYDFPGSNSGIDLHCLTGWIPEHIFISDKSFVADNVWDRILDGIKYGDVLVTIATGDMTEEEATEQGLVPTHAYAVIDIKQFGSKRLLQVKNPWSHKRWRGPYSHLDTQVWTDELKSFLNFDPCVAEKKDDGIFWIDFESVCENFTSIHLNWNPELFTHRWVLHSVWPEHVGPKKDVFSLHYNPQFSLTVNVPDKKPAAVWLLLSKHITVTEENTDYITLHVYDNTSGERVFYPGTPFKEGTYVNSPHILVRFNAPPGISDYTIVVSQHEKEHSLYFSLRAYSLAPFKLNEVPIRHSTEQKLTIPPASAPVGLLLMLEAPKDFAVHLMLVEGGKRAYSVSLRDILSESGPYRHGFCYCELPNIKQSIPSEGAGMFKKVLHGEWIIGYSAMGCPIRLQSINNTDSVPSMNVTIYEKHPTELFGKELATSGPYTNVIQGVATGDVVLSQNEMGYIIVLATHDKDIAAEYTVIIYSDRPVNVKNDK
ncbi:uncharacterized protein EV154DRAFT_415548 [Mucor mucedo]|uniref:uncharacterized protein n=1 Tax=Mucor mucedo TaxID=29922 RepID=UPI002220710A|nr:uncharacterized protein EV154DRAFT_415548 [Mucor mucedo]KAI7894172.1 hypothetical protein EV154DRAFT_415548 [Mucor mucedo]